jgi:CubicO group peptidase (beta-lactamase class C family)
MYLVEQNKLDLDQPLSTYLPYLKGSNKENITASQVLSHQAGLYPYFPFWKKAINELSIKKNPGSVEVGNLLQVEPLVADSIRFWAIHSDLLADRVDTITHEQYMYSDIGFYFLKDLVEQDTKMPMDRFLYQQLYFSLPTGLRFNPRQFFPIEAISPTEEDALLRNELVQGFVHDRNAALLGGVAGQAGLFGNAYDVAVMMQMQLNNGKFGGRAYFDEETVVEFTSRHFKNNRRGLGWDMPGPEPDGPISVLASDESFGHTGFTGCAVWADPKENLIFVFLSNRVYPSVENNKLIENNIRTRIQDVVYESLNKE